MIVHLPVWSLYFIVGGWLLAGICAWYIHALLHDYAELLKRQNKTENSYVGLYDEMNDRMNRLERSQTDLYNELIEREYFQEATARRIFDDLAEPDIPSIIGEHS